MRANKSPSKSLSSGVKERSLDMVGRRLAAFKSALKIQLNAARPMEPRTKMLRTLESWILVLGAWLHLNLH